MGSTQPSHTWKPPSGRPSVALSTYTTPLPPPSSTRGQPSHPWSSSLTTNRPKRTSRQPVWMTTDQHPVHRRLQKNCPPAPSLRLHPFCSEYLKNLKQIGPVLFPSWTLETWWDRPRTSQSRESALQDFQARVVAQALLTLLLYTNGSKLQSDATGAGWYCIWSKAGVVATQGHLHLPGRVRQNEEHLLLDRRQMRNFSLSLN